jgi:hypothetical protein
VLDVLMKFYWANVEAEIHQFLRGESRSGCGEELNSWIAVYNIILQWCNLLRAILACNKTSSARSGATGATVMSIGRHGYTNDQRLVDNMLQYHQYGLHAQYFVLKPAVQERSH